MHVLFSSTEPVLKMACYPFAPNSCTPPKKLDGFFSLARCYLVFRAVFKYLSDVIQ